MKTPTIPAASLILAALLAVHPDAQALESFSLTNVIANGASAAYGFTSFPTNSVSTNFVVTGYTTNVSGSVTNVSTNGYYPGQLTGKPIEVRNYAWNGFKFTGLCTSSNGGTCNFQLVRAISSSTPASIVNPATGQLTNSDWETAAQITLGVPIPRGTNQVVTWLTNLDEWFTKPADYVGIYTLTNNGQAGDSISNAWAGLEKKILPFSLNGGDF